MHTSKITIALGALLSAGAMMMQAQDAQAPAQGAVATAPAEAGGHHHHANPARQAKHLAKKLGLSQDQVAQIKPILAARQQQMEGLRADASLSQQDRRAKMRDIQQDSKTRIEAVLNDTQKQQFEQMLAERKAHARHHGQEQQPGV